MRSPRSDALMAWPTTLMALYAIEAQISSSAIANLAIG
jgi:hypothetical protein